MPRVPEYDQHVSTVVPEAPMPRFAPAVEGAFGRDVQEANARIGEQGQKIGLALMEYGRKQQEFKDDAITADLDTTFRKTLQDQLLSEEMEKVNVNGQDIERPKGILNRSLKQADGATIDFDKYYQTAKQAFMSAAPNAEHAQRLGAEMDRQYLSSRDNVITHEAKQNKNVLIQSQTSNLAQQVHDAGAINHPIDLLDAINKATATQNKINELTGVDPETAEKNLRDKAGDIVSNASMSTLRVSGLEKAQLLVDVAKEDIHPDRYEQITNSLVAKDKQMNFERKQIIQEKHDQSLANLQDKLISDELTEQDLEGAMNQSKEEGGLKKTEIMNLKKALYTIQEKNVHEVIHNNPDAQKYVELINDFSDNPTDVRALKSLIVKSYGDGIIDKSESKTMNELSKILKDDQWAKAKGFQSAAKGIQSWFGVKPKDHTELAQSLHELVTRSSGGENPMVVAGDIQNKQRLKQYPWIATLPAEGQIRILKDGSRVKVFPNGMVEAVK